MQQPLSCSVVLGPGKQACPSKLTWTRQTADQFTSYKPISIYGRCEGLQCGRSPTRHAVAVAVQVKNLEWEAEVLAQRFAAVQAERDSLYEKFEASVYDVAQKTGELLWGAVLGVSQQAGLVGAA